jgi:hypothetical protein
MGDRSVAADIRPPATTIRVALKQPVSHQQHDSAGK